MDPYDGQIFHEPPLVLTLYYLFRGIDESDSVSRLFVQSFLFLLEILTAYLLSRVCDTISTIRAAEIRSFLKQLTGTTEKLKFKILTQAKKGFLSQTDQIGRIVFATILLNPFSVLANCALTFEIFNHFLLVLTLYLVIRGHVAASAFVCSLANHMDVHVILLIPSLIMLLLQSTKKDNTTFSRRRTILISWCLIYISCLLGSFLISAELLNSWNFVMESYVWQFTMKDITPNIGFFWYTFMEMFDRFWSYYLFIWNINPVMYVIPIAYKFRDDPLLAFVSTYYIISLFRVFPTCGSITFAIILLLLHPEQLRRVHFLEEFVVALFAFSAMCFAQWHLWTETISGNANYFWFQAMGLMFTAMLIGMNFFRSAVMIQRAMNEVRRSK
jgi:GPI-anchor transamidase subunit U